jgi:hypothetical protein
MSLTRIATIRSHAGLARFIATLSDEPVAYLARVQVEEIPSPYRYSPVVAVYVRGEERVVWFETAHRRYEVFRVAPELLSFATEEEATEWHVRYSRAA